MSSISIKGIIVGALVDFAVAMALGIAVVAAFAISVGIEDLTDSLSAFEAGIPWIVTIILSCLPTVIGGYVSARVAKKGELINGTLCSLPSFTITILHPF